MAIFSHRETTSWRPGTLRLFESIGSIGAKYCYLNKIKPIEFSKLILELTVDRPEKPMVSDLTFGSLEFDFRKLSRLLGEPIAITNKLSLRAIDQLPNLYRHTRYSLKSKSNKNFSYCSTCLASGYHSSLHQIGWVGSCFIHGDILINEVVPYKTLPKVQYDVDLLNCLYAAWFSESDIWQSAQSYNWHLIDNQLIDTKANEFISALTNTETIVARQSMLSIGENPTSNLILHVNSSSNLNNGFKMTLQPNRICFKEPLHYTCATSAVDALVDMEPEDFYLLMHTRFATCQSKKPPIWKKTLDALPSTLKRKHYKCLQGYKKLFDNWSTVRYALGRRFQYVNIPYGMNSYQKVPCARIVTTNLAQVILNTDISLLTNMHGYHVSIFESRYLFTDTEKLNRLQSVGLVEKYTGFIKINQHKIIKKYEPDYLVNPIEYEKKRRVSTYTPSGLLTDIIDSILCAYIHSWLWALYETEINRNNYNIYYHSPTPLSFLKSKVVELSPSVILNKTKDGVELIIGTMTPLQSPDWTIVNHGL